MTEHALQLIIADDDFIAANRAREIFEEQSRDVADEMSKEVIDASVNKIDDAVSVCKQIAESAATVSLFGGKKVVWARNLNFLNDSIVAKSEKVREAIADMAETLGKLDPANAVVVINASPVNRTNKMLKTLQQVADFEDFKTKGAEDACVELLKMEAKKSGAQLAPRAAETIAAIVANNTRMALQELQKLAVYTNGERPITEEDVVDMVPIFGEGDFFEISNAFYSGNLKQALDSLRRYFFTNKTASARPIITVIQKQNSALIQLRSLMDAKILPRISAPQPKGSLANAASVFGKFFDGVEGKSAYNIFSQNEWYAGSKLAPVAACTTLKKLMDIQLNLTKAFEDLISRPGCDEVIMRELFIRSIS